MTDDFTVDTSVEFNDDGTRVSITFKNVLVDDVDHLFASLATQETQERFIAGLEAAVANRNGG